jgi:hypothetical protein
LGVVAVSLFPLLVVVATRLPPTAISLGHHNNTAVFVLLPSQTSILFFSLFSTQHDGIRSAVMADPTTALMSKIETPPIKMEALPEPCKEERSTTPSIKLEPVETEEVEIAVGDLSVRSQLVAYSSSPPPPPLMEDCPGLINGDANNKADSIIAPLRSESRGRSNPIQAHTLPGQLDLST